MMNHPPGPRLAGTPNALFVRRRPETFLALARKYGDLVYFKVGPRDIYLVSRPDLIERIFRDHYTHFEKDWGPRRGHSVMREGLVTSEGSVHRGQRLDYSRVFARATVEERMPEVARIVDDWVARQDDGARVDVFEEMSAISSDIAAQVLFGCRVDFAMAREAMNAIGAGFGRAMFPFAHRLRRRRAEHNAAVRTMIEYVKQHATDSGLLTPLLRMDADIEAQIATFIVAGQETVRIATAWAWFHLSGDRAAQQRLAAADAGARGGFAERVLNESMRLHPPQWMIGRRTVAPYELDGHQIPVGALVLVSPYVVHRDARYFPDPARFDPDRWLVPQAVRGTFIPFGGGPRRCIGEAFATLTGTAMLARIGRRWSFAFERGSIGYDARLTLHPKPMMARVRAVAATNVQQLSSSTGTATIR